MIILFVVSANDVSLIECQFKHILIVIVRIIHAFPLFLFPHNIYIAMRRYIQILPFDFQLVMQFHIQSKIPTPYE